MKRTDLIPSLTAALLLTAALSPAHAASLITDGDFDALPVGTAPDVGKPAGSWFWPADYMIGEIANETSPSQVSISPAPAGGTGNALRLSFGATEAPGMFTYLPNFFAQSVTRTSGKIIIASCDIYVAPGRGGGGAFLGQGSKETGDRGPQIHWMPDGTLLAWVSGNTGVTLASSYPRGVWQSVRLRIDLNRNRFDFFSGEKGKPVSVTKTNVPFRSDCITHINLFTIARWGQVLDADAQSYFDNIRVTTDPAIAPVTADLAAGGASTLQVVNLPAGDATFQWQRNGQNIAGATAGTLELSNVTGDQAGNYTVVVTRAGQSVTTEASTVRVFNQLTITTPPEKIEAVSGKTTGFSVAAVGPLPMAYQWRFNGADLPDKTNRFLTFPAKTDTAGALKAQAQPQANGQMVVSFAAAANQTYTVEASSGLSGGTWEKVADVVAQSADRTETVTDPQSGEAARFYRVVTPRRP